MAEAYMEWAERTSNDGDALSKANACSLDNLVWTASVGKSHFNHRKAIVSDKVQSLIEQLASGRDSFLSTSTEVVELLSDLSVRKFKLSTLSELQDHGLNCILEIGSCNSRENGNTAESLKAISTPRVIAGSLPNPAAQSENTKPDHLLMLAVKDCYESHLNLQLRGLFAGEQRRKLTLPTYAFQRRKYWFND